MSGNVLNRPSGTFMVDTYIGIPFNIITPGIQKHVTVINTRNGDILRSGNIKGGMF